MPLKTKAIVCVSGSRYWTDVNAVESKLCKCWEKYPLLTVIEGGQRGADAIARRWALERKDQSVNSLTFMADWKQLGKKAGPIRNADMVDYLVMCKSIHNDVVGVIAFPLTSSIGTYDMVRKAEREGITVWMHTGLAVKK